MDSCFYSSTKEILGLIFKANIETWSRGWSRINQMGETWTWIFLRFYPIKTFKMKKKGSRDTLVTRLILHLDMFKKQFLKFPQCTMSVQVSLGEKKSGPSLLDIISKLKNCLKIESFNCVG